MGKEANLGHTGSFWSNTKCWRVWIYIDSNMSKQVILYFQVKKKPGCSSALIQGMPSLNGLPGKKEGWKLCEESWTDELWDLVGK